jgi:hypothetical protein
MRRPAVADAAAASCCATKIVQPAVWTTSLLAVPELSTLAEVSALKALHLQTMRKLH